MMRSDGCDEGRGPNVAPQPNVAPRREAELRADSRFCRAIRGRKAIVTYLNWLGYNGLAARPSDAHLVRNGHLTKEQLEQIADALACAHCGTVPVGMGWHGQREFRCEQPDCPDRGGAPRGERP